MRTLSLTALLLLTTTLAADDKPAKWEYAELSFRSVSGRPALKNKDGNELPAVPASTSIKWATGDGEVAVKGWDELAENLKAPLKKETPASLHRIQVLNILGGQGWELVNQQSGTSPFNPGEPGRGFGTASTTLLFKRRVQ